MTPRRVQLPTSGQYRQCVICGQPMDVLAGDTDTERWTSETCGHDVTDQLLELAAVEVA